MSKAKKIFKIIGFILLGLIIVCILFIIVSLINHKVKSAKEWTMLEEKGYVNLVDARDYKMNAPYWGNTEGKHTVVCMSGMGVVDCSLTMRKITKGIEDDCLIVCLDRAGYGLSDDTKDEQTCESIVENCRTALKNAGFEAPYILMPHSIAGIYSTYWESVYPDEIEGILFLDTTPVLNKEIFEDEKPKGAVTEFLYTFSCDVGLDRFFPKLYWTYLPDFYTEEEIEIHNALYAQSSQTHALISENNNINKNSLLAYEKFIKTDIPKTYIGSSYHFETVDDFKQFIEVFNEDMRRSGKPEDHKTDEEYEQMLPGFNNFWEQNYVPYIESLGNCEIVTIPTGHMTYEYKPDEVGEVLVQLVEKVEAAKK